MFQNFPEYFWTDTYATAVFFVLLAWSLVWKGIALWKSAKLDDKWWFIALLVVNTVGILEILYIYYFSKRERNN